MNKNLVITNITLIADAAEYFDRKIGSAWKIRAAMTNSLVWAANRLINMEKNKNTEPDQLVDARVTLATLRVWAKDMNTTSLSLDLLHGSIRRTLGLDREVDPHEEACRVARDKCQRARSAVRFTEFYNAAREALDEQRRQREEAVESIAWLLSQNGFSAIDLVKTDGLVVNSHDEFVLDEEIYDENMVEYQFDQLSEHIANVLESMHVQCNAELSAAIVTNKITRLSSFMTAIESMMDIVGVDKSKLDIRQVALEKQMDEAETKIKASMQTVEADIEGEISKLMAQQNAEPQEPTKPKRHMVKGKAA